jgi:hypothetical protein
MWIAPVSDLGLAVGEVQLLSVTRQVLRHLLQNLHPPIEGITVRRWKLDKEVKQRGASSHGMHST